MQLLERGINIRLQDKKGNAPLHYAVINSESNAVLPLLVQNQAPLNVQNEAGETALFMATQQGDEKVVDLLLQAGANTNISNVEEASPLHVAAANNDVNIMSALLSYGAHVNARDACGDTPLHWAVREGHAEAAKLLLNDYRCDRNARNEDNETPRDIAVENNMAEAFILFPAMHTQQQQRIIALGPGAALANFGPGHMGSDVGHLLGGERPVGFGVAK